MRVLRNWRSPNERETVSSGLRATGFRFDWIWLQELDGSMFYFTRERYFIVAEGFLLCSFVD